MRHRARRSESGSVLVWGAGALAAAALLGLFVAREARLRLGRLRARTAADATVLAAATAYARGLNVAAASNQVLSMAAAADALLLLSGEGELTKALKVVRRTTGGAAPVSFTELVYRFQDAWAGTGGPRGLPLPGLAGAFMAATVAGVGASNGLATLAFWNPGASAVPLAPDLRVRRATMAEVTALFGGTRIPVEGKRDTVQYSYWDRRLNRRVTISNRDVEQLAFRRNGRERVQARMREGAGNLAGKFLRKTRVAEKVLKFLDVPFPLLETSTLHRVLLVARPATGGPVVAAAEAYGGAVFSPAFGDPSFDVRLVAEPPPAALGSAILAAVPAGTRTTLATGRAR